MNIEIIEYLTRLKSIYLVIDENMFRKDVAKLEKIIDSFKETSEKIKFKPKSPKASFNEIYQLLLERNFKALSGTKLNYEELTTRDHIESYCEKNSKSKILKETTALDLKLLYSLLAEDPNEIKGNKNEVLDAIKRNVRARKRGEAFKQTI